VKDVCHHGFRKSAARHMYEKMGRNHEALLTVQKVLNHSNPNTTLVYIGIDMKRMNDAFNIL
jgi:integrase